MTLGPIWLHSHMTLGRIWPHGHMTLGQIWSHGHMTIQCSAHDIVKVLARSEGFYIVPVATPETVAMLQGLYLSYCPSGNT